MISSPGNWSETLSLSTWTCVWTTSAKHWLKTLKMFCEGPLTTSASHFQVTICKSKRSSASTRHSSSFTGSAHRSSVWLTPARLLSKMEILDRRDLRFERGWAKQWNEEFLIGFWRGSQTNRLKFLCDNLSQNVLVLYIPLILCLNKVKCTAAGHLLSHLSFL